MAFFIASYRHLALKECTTDIEVNTMPLKIGEIVKIVNGKSVNCNTESIITDIARKIIYVKTLDG